jgi:glycosyltransferase involved in cell wall biosynthesis
MIHPLVSVVIPVYNQDRYLARTIDSVLAQDYPRIECTVVDDGSTDASADVAAAYGARIELLRQPNGGQARALNAGFARARGELIGYLSSDDTIDATLVSRVVARVREHPRQPVVVFPRYRTIDPDDAVLDAACPAFAGVDHMVEQFRCNIGPGAFFSRDVLHAVIGWNADYRQIPDYEFWLRAARVATFHQLDAVLASFRVHPGSQTYAPSSFAKADESVRLAADVMHRATTLPPGPDAERFFASAYVYSACLHLRSRRFGPGLQRLAAAWRHSKQAALRPDAIRRVARSILAGAALPRARVPR